MFSDDLDAVAAASRDAPFDSVIVGGGTSGLAVAATLIEAGRRVLILEAGPAPFLTHILNTELRYAGALLRTVRDRVRYRPAMPDGGFFGTNFGCLGGRGLFWNGAAPRFSPALLSVWPEGAAPRESDYRWAEKQFRVTRRYGETQLATRLSGLLGGEGFAAEAGPYAVEPGDGDEARLGAGIASGLGLFFRIAGAAVAAGQAQLAVQAMVDRIILDGGVACGVGVSTPGGAAVEIFSRSVMLAGGGIESIKLVAISGIPDPGGRIGKGLQDHLFYNALLDAPQHYFVAAPDTAIVYVPAASAEAHQWELHAPGNRMFAFDDGSAWAPGLGAPYQLMIRSFAATEKRDDNRVESRPGPLGSALVHFTHSDKDRARMTEMAGDAVRIATALEATAADAVPLDSLDRIRAPGSSYHEAGGLDMGKDPATSVTDAHGAFHAVGNLVCGDAASFPLIGATNPHLTLLACARKKALALNERLNAS